MQAESRTPSPVGDGERRATGYRPHLLGLFGANLVVGAIVLWLAPLLAHRLGAGAGWSRLLPWIGAADTTATAIAVVALAALIGGAALVVRAARMLAARVES